MNRRGYLLFFVSALMFGILLSCKKSTAPIFHFEYFGLTPGRYVIYDVMEVTHDQALLQHDTIYYQLKTYWGPVYIDNEGREAREFHRYKRDSVTTPWGQTEIWTGIIDGIRAELIEENQRVVKLVFAPTYEKEWDANAYNISEEMECYYTNIHEGYTAGTTSFDSTLIVEQEDSYNLIDTVRMYEVYAKNIGLIYKYYKDNQYQFGSSEVVLGKELYYTFYSAGFE